MDKQNENADSTVSTEEGAAQTKQEHIKERLKDLGVSDDSKRPKKSWLSQYGSYAMLAVVITLIVIYWLENKTPITAPVEQTAQQDTPVVPNQNANAHQQNQMAANNQTPPWLQQNIQHHRMMQQQAWEQQKMRYDAWQKQVREQQEKNRQAWEQYLKQQQAMNQRRMPANGTAQGNLQQQNQNPQYAGSPPPYWNNFQNNQGPDPRYMNGYNQMPPSYQVPPAAYQQPYPNQYYYNGR